MKTVRGMGKGISDDFVELCILKLVVIWRKRRDEVKFERTEIQRRNVMVLESKIVEWNEVSDVE